MLIIGLSEKIPLFLNPIRTLNPYWATYGQPRSHEIRYNEGMANTIEINLRVVEELACLGFTEQQIADSLGISRSTLSRRKTNDE
jgi:hypothetical protein